MKTNRRQFLRGLLATVALTTGLAKTRVDEVKRPKLVADDIISFIENNPEWNYSTHGIDVVHWTGMPEHMKSISAIDSIS